ncbi:hypothetical protein H310_02555 [Aphanomyces invadans]|uniref:Uncharacterized protein n=1 Tax=Aphanomyces invadans TaxID=157072 RepID=A0A024UII5_9STRA|nr:hypothetical protein H310_02555 [Aphanomyces invadans]ETW06261.1 hypothetical protein H310_02555 [Aphanomyces invadans]|eukprot:XP_008864336.1 hypothetical protein H310_02555 [Aphanomyces invadans]
MCSRRGDGSNAALLRRYRRELSSDMRTPWWKLKLCCGNEEGRPCASRCDRGVGWWRPLTLRPWTNDRGNVLATNVARCSSTSSCRSRVRVYQHHETRPMTRTAAPTPRPTYSAV